MITTPILSWISVIVVILTVSTVLWINIQKSRWINILLNWFPPILFAYVIPALFTYFSGLDLSQVMLHDISKSWIIPFTILVVMSALPFDQLKIVGIKPIIVFLTGSLIIAITPVILVFIYTLLDEGGENVFLIQEYWKGLVPIVGGWIGGSTSQLVLKELVQTPEDLFLSILVLDNILVNLWTVLMFQFIKKSNAFNKAFGINESLPSIEIKEKREDTDNFRFKILTIAVAVCVMILSKIIEVSFLINIVILSIVGLILGNVSKFWDHKLMLKLAGVLIIIIMAVLGLKLNFNNLTLPIELISLVILWLVIHFMAMLVSAIVLKVNIAWVAIGSMANLGGISTAPAVTSAYKKELMPHAIVLAILSMVTGTGWGMLTIYLFYLM